MKGNLPTSKEVISRETAVSTYVNEVLANKLPRNISPLSVNEFFDFPNEEDNNLERIWAQYDEVEKEDYESDYSNKNLPYIKPGTVILIPTTKIQLDFQQLTRQGQFLSQSDYNLFWAEKYEALLADQNYNPDESVTGEDVDFDIRVIPQNIKVWIYIKALDKILDISSLVQSCSTDKRNQTGSFQLITTPIKNQEEILGYQNGSISQHNIVTKEGWQVKSLLEKYVAVNDVVFIRFEKLRLETGASLAGEADSLEISPTDLVNTNSNYTVWDMIGFVDDCTIHTDHIGTNQAVAISGQDFTKLFIEDGSYFMPLKWIEGSRDRWFYGGNEEDEWFKRNIVTGNYDYLFNYGFRGIKDTLWFVINNLSNIGITPDNLFSSYGDRRTTSYEIDDDENYKQKLVKGIWQIVKVFVSGELDDRTVVDPSFANPDGTLMTFISKICQEPFVEVIFDTYIDTLDIVVRQPPFTEKAIQDVITNDQYIEIKPVNLLSSQLSYDDRVYSWYQLFPQNNFVGTKDYSSLAFIPIIYLNEYTKIWGNKKQQIQDIYISLGAIESAEGGNQLNSMAAAMLNDLLFVLETSVYLPFTRRGTITINGDRRIKVGSFIKLESTDELFYVTGVTQSVNFIGQSVDRTTTLQVERGMYFPILTNDKDTDIKNNTDSGSLTTSSGVASYFKIVDIDRIREDITNAEKAVENEEKHKINGNNSVVDINQFNYFLERRMYGSGD